jgi:hypothetical protein
VRPEIPAKLDEVVMRALERDRNARWQSAADMLAALNRYLYSLDETPGPRDVAALVARFCPPETRRLPTHLEAAAHESVAPEPLGDDASGPAAATPAAASGPSTAVIPRDQQARGKPQRQQTFATNVDMKSILDRATPLVPFDAIDGSPDPERKPSPRLDAPLEKTTSARGDATELDTSPPAADSPAGPPTTKPSEPPSPSTKPSEPPSTKPSEPPSARRLSRPMEVVDEPEESIERPIRRTPRSGQMAVESDDPRPPAPLANIEIPKQLREPPSRFVLILAGLGALGLGIAAVVVFFEGREQVLRGRPDAGAPPAEAAVAPDAGVADAAAVEPDAIVPVAVPIDAGGHDLARDAGPRAPVHAPDASVDAAPAVKGTATLQIGADPWGEIYVDGKPAGRTPRELTVPAGRHTIEVVFPAEQPPRKQTFAVDLANGETKPLQADFSH